MIGKDCLPFLFYSYFMAKFKFNLKLILNARLFLMSGSFGSIDEFSGIQSSKEDNKGGDLNSMSIDDDFELFASKSSSNNSEGENEATAKSDHKSTKSNISSKSSKSNSSQKSASSTQKSVNTTQKSASSTQKSNASSKSSKKSDTNQNNESAADLSLANTNSKLSSKVDSGLSGSFLDATNPQSTIKSSSKSKSSTIKDDKEETNKSTNNDLIISSKPSIEPSKSEVSQAQGSILLSNTSQLSSKQSNQSKSDIKSSNNSKISTKNQTSKSQSQEETPKLEQLVRQQRKPWYEEDNQKQPQNNDKDKDAEIERLTNILREQRTVIENQKETIRLLMNEAVSHEEISSLRAALASKSPLLQLVAATPMSEQRATKQLRAENAALRREIDEMETRHLNELKAMRAQFALLSSRPMPTDGCAQCKRRIRELESQLKLYQDKSGQ